jgi:hypothetical protein
MYSLVTENAPSAQLVDFARPSLVVVSPERSAELDAYETALPGGARSELRLCSEIVAETYFVPGGGSD